MTETPSDTATAPTKTLIFMFVTVLLSMVGFGIIIPIMPQLMMEVTNTNVSQAATYGGLVTMVYALAQFVTSPILGGLSDRYGRRPVLLLSPTFYSLDFLLLALAPNFAWLFVARALSGATAATYATANAVIADVSPPEKRSANFGLIGAGFGLGFIIGPVIGGFLAEYGTRVPFFAASAIGALNVLFGYFVFPETLKEKRTFSWKRANPLGSLMSVSNYKYVPMVLSAIFLIQFAYNSLPAVFAYFAEFSYGWSPLDIAWALAFVGLTSAIVQGGLTRKLIPMLGEARAVLLGAGCLAASFVGYSFFSPGGGAIYFWIAVGSFGGLVMPSMQTIMTTAAPKDGQGELQGAVASVMSLAMMTSPLIMTRMFTAYTDEVGAVVPGAPLVLGTACILAAMVPFALIVFRPKADAQASPGASA